MTQRPASLRAVVVVLLLTAAAGCSGPGDSALQGRDTSLRFAIAEGESQNHFVIGNGVSAHLNLRSVPAPRLVVAFPAGNSGGVLSFAGDGAAPAWGAVTNLETVAREDTEGRTLYGISADIDVEAGPLVLEEADVGSVRFLRKAVDYSQLPPRPPADMDIDDDRVRYTRQRPDGRSSYLLEVGLLAGELRTVPRLGFVPGDDGRLRIRVTVASGDPLESPVAVNRLLASNAADNDALENVLGFLSLEGKMLAGSWRFLTYFGRDTLLSVRLLMPVLTAEAAEIGLGSVFERINDRGEVAHEEEIGELAVYRNLAERGEATAKPVYDYNMVDDNLMLAPVLDSYIATFGAERAATFLSGRLSSGESLRARLLRNLLLVVAQGTAFAGEPLRSNLVAIRDGSRVGNWRDSQEGLVGGRYPYDVNAVLMPAALRATARIVDYGLLDQFTDRLPDAAELERMAGVWQQHAAGLFVVQLDAGQAAERLAGYARDNGYPVGEIPDAGVQFFAVALDEELEPIPVMHSDTAMDLLFLDRPARQLGTIVRNLARQFPVGLATPVGVLAANPAYAGDEARALVTRNHYHGTVIWSWQQAMMIAGLDRQLDRDDLSKALRQELRTARQTVWQGAVASDEILNSELWSFAVHDGVFVIAPFGQSAGHLTESNAAQLWSTVFLALDPPVAEP